MPKIRSIDLADARRRLKGRTSGHDDRAPYREAIARMTDDRMIELQPDAGETMRKLKVTVSRAAKEINREIKYGESENDTLLVWLEKAKPVRRRRTSVATQ